MGFVPVAATEAEVRAGKNNLIVGRGPRAAAKRLAIEWLRRWRVYESMEPDDSDSGNVLHDGPGRVARGQ